MICEGQWFFFFIFDEFSIVKKNCSRRQLIPFCTIYRLSYQSICIYTGIFIYFKMSGRKWLRWDIIDGMRWTLLMLFCTWTVFDIGDKCQSNLTLSVRKNFKSVSRFYCWTIAKGYKEEEITSIFLLFFFLIYRWK